MEKEPERNWHWSYIRSTCGVKKGSGPNVPKGLRRGDSNWWYHDGNQFILQCLKGKAKQCWHNEDDPCWPLLGVHDLDDLVGNHWSWWCHPILIVVGIQNVSFFSFWHSFKGDTEEDSVMEPDYLEMEVSSPDLTCFWVFAQPVLMSLPGSIESLPTWLISVL